MQITNPFTHQPKELRLLFFVEMWERFSFYGMRALLVLYMTKFFHYSDDQSYSIYGAYGALVYGSPILGGYLADKILGLKNSIVIGGILMVIGHALMSFTDETMFFIALSFIALGNGFFKPNISSLLGITYEKNDPRRDSGFLIFYMGINIGAICMGFFSLLGEGISWHYGFGLAGLGMAVGLVTFIKNKKTFAQKGDSPLGKNLFKPFFIEINQLILIVLGIFLIAIPGFYFLLKNTDSVSYLLGFVGSGTLIYIFYQSSKLEKQVRLNIYATLVLTFFSILFFAFFEQAGSSMNLFTDRNVDRVFWGINVSAGFFQSLNPMFVILLAPFFSILWLSLGKIGKEPSTPFKFSMGLIFLALGFFQLWISKYFASSEAMVSVSFLVLAYFWHTAGELCLSPVGLSMVSKMSPRHLSGVMMGTWFLASSFSHHLGGIISKLTSIQKNYGENANSILGLEIYTNVFFQIGCVASISALAMLLLSPIIQKWMKQTE